MSDLGTGSIAARAYEVIRGRSGHIGVRLASVALQDARVQLDTLIGQDVAVVSRAVLVSVGLDGALSGVPVQFAEQDGIRLEFDPAGGGVRTRINRLEGGRYNEVVAQATRFGMVNAFHHVSRGAGHVNRLLREIGASALPPVVVVVGAHSASKLPGYAQGDGDLRSGRMRPLSGGHYRVSTLTSGVPEIFPVTPTGEIHLGPGRVRQPYAGQTSYLLGAAHNPATMYHEYGHHVCRHTADLRLNAERRPECQRNGKPGVEEGLCDYFAASLLGTGRPYGWYRPQRGERRDPGRIGDGTRREPASADPHELGRPWATAFWRSRERLIDAGLLAGPEAHDRALLRALIEIGTVASRRADRRRRAVRQLERSSGETIIAAYRGAIREAGGPRAEAIVEEVFRLSTAGSFADPVVED